MDDEAERHARRPAWTLLCGSSSSWSFSACSPPGRLA